MRMNVWTLRAALAAAVALLALPARADITPDARQVVERYLAASGGRAAHDSVRTLRIKATLSAFGFKGTSTSYQARPDRQASDTQLGPFHVPAGFDGTTGWRVDPSGKLIVLDGKDLEEARAGAYFDNQRWLDPDQGGGSVKAAGTEKDSLGTYTVLEITPPVGRSRRYWFDAKTGLLVRDVEKHDQQEVMSDFSDFRPVAGVLMPFRSLQRIAGMPANDLTLVVDSVWVNEPLEDSRFKPPAAAAARVAWLKAPGRAEIPFRYLGRHVWLKVSVNGGEPADFIFDTGASITVVYSAYEAKIGLVSQGEQQSQGAGAMGSARFSELRSIRVAGDDGDGVDFSGQKIGVLSVNPFLAPHFWRDCAGVLGADFISSFVTEIDYDRGTLTLHDPKTFTYTGQGTAIPFVLAGNMPAIPMKLDGTYEGAFRVDVGSSSTVDVHGPYVEKHDLRRVAGHGLEVRGGGFGGTFTSQVTRMKKIEIGPYSWTEPLVTLSEAKVGALASEDYAGNVGNRILDRFKCTFDYERRKLYLEPGKRYTERDRVSRSGLELGRFGETVKVLQVVPGSPAEKAGLREDDVVTSIDGKPALSWTPDGLDELFEKGEIGRKVALETVRDGKTRKVTLKLADLL